MSSDKWAVVAPSDSEWVSAEAVRRQVRLLDWCLMIVFDSKEPSVNYDTGWYLGRGNKAVIYLTQNDRGSLDGLIIMKDIPWSDHMYHSAG